MLNPIIEIALLLILFIANGALAMAEMAVVSARKIRLQQKAEAGDENARTALELARQPADFLSTVQIGITLVGVLAGAFGGATLAARIAPWIEHLPWLAPYSQAVSLVLVVLIITYLSLILGELTPKRLALADPDRVAAAVARPMQALSRLALPVVRLLSASSDVILHLVGARHSDEPPVTEEEVKILIEMGTQAGIFEQAEQEMVSGVFRLADRRVDSIMTPRTEITWVDLEDPEEEIRRTIIDSIYTILPVAEGDLDHILGVVQAKDLLARCLQAEVLDLRAALVPPQFVPESKPALKVLDLFRRTHMNVALVIDEFGGLQGMVTLIDILEAIVGDLPGLGEEAKPEALQREDGSWLLDGLLPVDELMDLLKLSSLPVESRNQFQTLGGLVMASLGRIPQSGDHFEWQGLKFEVLDMDGFRVDKVLVSSYPDQSQATT
jgi:putative hemolysin